MTLIIHTILSALVAGTAVTVALVAGATSALVLLVIAAVGVVVTWPVSHMIAKALLGDGK
ncbi:MAG: CTP synthetase [Brevirhabdus sp.]